MNKLILLYLTLFGLPIFSKKKEFSKIVFFLNYPILSAFLLFRKNADLHIGSVRFKILSVFLHNLAISHKIMGVQHPD